MSKGDVQENAIIIIIIDISHSIINTTTIYLYLSETMLRRKSE